MTSPVLLGVRHHGPGSARAVRRALSAYQPEVVLIEGPPEADPLVPLAGDEDMRAPVALLAYPADAKGGRDRHAAPATPAAGGVLAVRRVLPGVAGAALGGGPRRAGALHRPAGRRDRLADGRPAAARRRTGGRTDPIGALAAAAGYDDPERWWEDVVEHRSDLPADGDELTAALAPFAAIAEAMAEVRARRPAPPEAERVDEERREATMRAAAARRAAGVRAGRRGVRRLARAGADRAAAHGHRRRRSPARAAQGQGRDDLGAVDARPAGLLAGVRRGRRARPAGTTTCSPRPPAETVAAVAGAGRRGAAPRRAAGLQRPRHRGDPARRRAGDHARPAGAGPDRGHRRRPGGAVRGRPAAAGADPAAAGGRRAAGPGARPHAGRADRARRRRLAAAAAAAARSAAPRRSTSTCAARSTSTAAGCCTGSALLGVDWGMALPGRAAAGARSGSRGGWAGSRSSPSTWWRPARTGRRCATPRPPGSPSRPPPRRSLADVTALVEQLPAGRAARRAARGAARRSTSGWRSTTTSRT